MSLLWNLVRKDYKRNRIITTALASFLTLSSLLMAVGLRVTGTIVSSLRGLNQVAVPPDYVQMHKGAYDEESYLNFIQSQDYITDSLTIRMLNINNVSITHQGDTLENCLMDNGFVVQNENFDYLLTMENERAVVRDGDIGVPVYYMEELGIQVGDNITLIEGDYSKEFTVSTIIRDSTMNSALSYSKRFLLSKHDLEEVSLHMGEWEYCFEFMLDEGTSTSTLEKNYIDAGMPSNGVAVTGSLLTMLNGLSYGLVAFMVIAISLLLILISILCLSYIIRATMAEENVTVGELKAIGVPRKEIVKLYQMKYYILSMITVITGYLLSIPFGKVFSSTVIKYCGEGNEEWLIWSLPFLGEVFLCMIVLFRCKHTIGKNLKHSVVELMRGMGGVKREGHYVLPKSELRYHNLTIALGELRCKWKEYVVIFIVFILSSLLILVPRNMNSTVENPSFITYMGVGECDIRIDIPYSETLLEQNQEFISYLKQDQEIEKYVVYQNGYVEIQKEEGDLEYLRVVSGDESVFPIKYLKGSTPKGRDEIALSYMNASELGKEVDDSILIFHQGKQKSYRVSGVYQDITYGGKTAKAAISFNPMEVEAETIYLNLKEGVSVEKKTKALRDIFKGNKVVPVDEFVAQTIGGVRSHMTLVQHVANIISLTIMVLITVLFLQLIMAREHRAIAIKKAIGFSNHDLRIQFGIRILIIELIAIVIGTMTSKVMGETIFSVLLSGMGASKITMLVNPSMTYVLCPVAQLMVVIITILVGTNKLKTYHIKNQIME